MNPIETNPAVIFGDFVRNTRMGKGLTARIVASSAEMLPSNFSKLEHGLLTPPRDAEKQRKLLGALNILVGSADAEKFFDLAAKAANSTPIDLAQIISENETVPLLLRTIGNKRLSEDQIRRLVAIVHAPPPKD
ncbi:MAG: helix-turn-helix domain-containing protein [Opitutaceae bacterium]